MGKFGSPHPHGNRTRAHGYGYRENTHGSPSPVTCIHHQRQPNLTSLSPHHYWHLSQPLPPLPISTTLSQPLPPSAMHTMRAGMGMTAHPNNWCVFSKILSYCFELTTQLLQAQRRDKEGGNPPCHVKHHFRRGQEG